MSNCTEVRGAWKKYLQCRSFVLVSSKARGRTRGRMSECPTECLTRHLVLNFCAVLLESEPVNRRQLRLYLHDKKSQSTKYFLYNSGYKSQKYNVLALIKVQSICIVNNIYIKSYFNRGSIVFLDVKHFDMYDWNPRSTLDYHRSNLDCNPIISIVK